MVGQHNNSQSNAHHYKGGNFYVSRGHGRVQGCGCFNNNYPCLTNPFPTLYIEQAPESTSPEALSTVTNTDNSNKSNKQTYVLKHFKNQPNRGEKNSRWLHNDALSTVTNTNNSNTSNKQTHVLKHFKDQPNRGENNSQWLHDDVVNCESVYLDEILCCESAANAIQISNLAAPCINLYTHHLYLLTLQHSQDEILNEHILNKNNTAFVFDTECIQEIDNFIINTYFF